MPTSSWRPRQTCDVPFSPNSITPTSQSHETFPDGEKPVKVTGFSGTCRGRYEEVGIVEFGLKTAVGVIGLRRSQSTEVDQKLVYYSVPLCVACSFFSRIHNTT